MDDTAVHTNVFSLIADYVKKTSIETKIWLYFSKLYDGTLGYRGIEEHLPELERLLLEAERFNSTSSVPIRTERFYEALPILTLRAKGDYNI